MSAESNKRIYTYVFLLLFCFLYFFAKGFILRNDLNSDKLVFLNVGMGDGFLLKSGGHILLIDGGPSFKNYNKIFKYTFNKKPTNFLITHHHSDHISADLFALEFVLNYDLFSPSLYNNTFQSNYLAGRVTKNLHKGDKIKVGNFLLQVIWPPAGCTSKNINDCSMVLLVTHKNGKKVLLMSDSEYSSQEQYYKDLPQVAVIKVPHQGSRDSLNPHLLEHIKPSLAVISVAPNKYGHPHKEVLDFYKKQNIKILRTDEVGDIVLMFK